MTVEAADEVRLDLFLLRVLGPAAFNIGDHRPDLGGVQGLVKSRHIAFHSTRRKLNTAEGDVVEQLAVRMLPGVTAVVLGRCWIAAVGALLFIADLGGIGVGEHRDFVAEAVEVVSSPGEGGIWNRVGTNGERGDTSCSESVGSFLPVGNSPRDRQACAIGKQTGTRNGRPSEWRFMPRKSKRLTTALDGF